MEMGQGEEAQDGQDWAREWGRRQRAPVPPAGRMELPAQLSPGLCLPVPSPFCIISVSVCVGGVPVSVWWSVVGVLCTGAFHSYLHNGRSLRIYFSFQFPNFDRQAWGPGLSLCKSRGSLGGVAGSRQGQASHRMAIVALRGGVLGTWSWVWVGQGIQMWGPPYPAGSLLDSCPWRIWDSLK